MAEEEKLSGGAGTKAGTNAIPTVKPSGGGGDGPNVIVVIIVLVVIQALVVAAIWFFAFRLPKEKPNLAKELKNPEDTVQVEDTIAHATSILPGEMILQKETEITVNVAGTNGERFLQAWISVAYDSNDKGNKDILTKMANFAPQMKSKAEEYLSGLTIDDINSKGIRQKICRDLTVELNGIVPKGAGKLSNVYLEKFIVQ